MSASSRGAAASVPRRVLYLHTTSEVGGSDVSLLRLVEGLDRSRFQPVVALPSDGPLVPRLEQAGCDVYRLPRMKKLTSRRGRRYLIGFAMNYPAAVVGLARLVRRANIDLIHTNTIHNLYGIGAARLTGRPHVWHVREIVWQSRAVRRLEVGLARRCSDRVIVTSDAVAAMFVDRAGRRPANLRQIANGVDLHRFAPGPSDARLAVEWGLPPGAPLVAAVCRLDAWKGVDVFLRAAALVRGAHPAARFLVVGGAVAGQEGHARELEQLAAASGLGETVRFTGWRYTPADMPDVYRALRVLVLPSSQPEPFGLVLLEAMAAGVATIATAHGGPAEIVVDGETGTLVPPRDPQAMATAIGDLLADPDRARAMGRAGRDRVERFFDLRRTVERIQAVYDELRPA